MLNKLLSDDIGTVDTVDKLGIGTGTGIHDDLIDLGRGDLRNLDRARTVDNVDKKLVRFDDDVKLKILGDKHLLIKQKFILDVLINLHKPMRDDTTDVVHIVDGEIYYKVRIVQGKTISSQSICFLFKSRISTKSSISSAY